MSVLLPQNSVLFCYVFIDDFILKIIDDTKFQNLNKYNMKKVESKIDWRKLSKEQNQENNNSTGSQKIKKEKNADFSCLITTGCANA